MRILNLVLHGICITLCIFSIIQCQKSEVLSDDFQNKSGVVALYSDRGCWEESVQAAEKMFGWIECTVVQVNAEYINNEGLDNFNILCIPGGDMYKYAQDINSTGKKNIREFIHEGGSYIGICGGAYFASEKVIWQGNQLLMVPLGLFPGTATGVLDDIIPFPDYGMCKVSIADTAYIITQSCPDSAWMLYYWGPALIPSDDADVVILGQYELANKPAMIAFDYGLGRVFLVGTHPEIEEDSDRDGLTFAETLDDRGSDWDMMKDVVTWLLNRE